MSGVSVAVIGAGLAGLRTASELSRAGYEVTVLEGLSVVGGSAAGSFRDGFSLDGTLPLVRSSDRALISWIEQSELSASLLPPRACIDSQIHRGEIGPIDTSTLSDLAKIPGVTTWDKKRLLRLPRLMARYRAQLDPDRPELAANLDYRSARDFATLYLGKSVWDYWVSPETTSQYASDEMELSRVAFLLSRMTSREGKVALGVMRQGLWQLAGRAASRLNVVHDLWADEVTERGDGGYQVHCSFATEGGDTHARSMSMPSWWRRRPKQQARLPGPFSSRPSATTSPAIAGGRPCPWFSRCRLHSLTTRSSCECPKPKRRRSNVICRSAVQRMAAPRTAKGL